MHAKLQFCLIISFEKELYCEHLMISEPVSSFLLYKEVRSGVYPWGGQVVRRCHVAYIIGASN